MDQQSKERQKELHELRFKKKRIRSITFPIQIIAIILSIIAIIRDEYMMSFFNKGFVGSICTILIICIIICVVAVITYNLVAKVIFKIDKINFRILFLEKMEEEN